MGIFSFLFGTRDYTETTDIESETVDIVSLDELVNNVDDILEDETSQEMIVAKELEVDSIIETIEKSKEDLMTDDIERRLRSLDIDVIIDADDNDYE